MNSRWIGKRLPWLQQIPVFLFAFYIAWNIVDNGYEKLTFEPDTVAYFQSIGVPLSGMISAGIVEVFGSLLLFIPQVSFYAALLVLSVMVTATYYNQGGDSVTITCAALALIIAILSRPDFFRKRPKITTIRI